MLKGLIFLKQFSVRFVEMTKPKERIIVKESIIGENNTVWVGEVEAVNERGGVKASGKFEFAK